MIQIISNAPTWAWIVLAVLIVLGGMQTRRRQLKRTTVLILPIVMPIFALLSIGLSVVPLAAWAAGVAVALLLNGRVLQAPRDVRYDATTAQFDLPGTWTPLALMLLIFCTRFVIIATAAVNPALAASTAFVLVTSALLGFFAGLFVSRALVILAAATAPLTARA